MTSIKNNKKGFPIIALFALIIVAVGILVAMIPSLQGYVNETQKEALITQAKTIYITTENIIENSKKNNEFSGELFVETNTQDFISQKIREFMGEQLTANYTIEIDDSGKLNSFTVYDSRFKIDIDPKTQNVTTQRI